MLTLIGFIRKVFKPDTKFCSLITVFTLFITSVIIFSLIYFFICTPSQFNSNIIDKKGLHIKPVRNYLDTLYFSFITQSTTGFGDISPKGHKTKFVVMLQILSVIIIASM